MDIDRVFAIVLRTVLVLAGLVFLVQVGMLIWLPGRVYEAAATFALYPAAPTGAQEGLQAVWTIVPPGAAVGLELVQGEPHVYRLSYRSSDPAQAAKQANDVAAVVQANAVRTGMGRFEIVHPAAVPTAWTSPRHRQLRSDLFLLVLAGLPIVVGLRMTRRRPALALNTRPT